MCPRTNTVCITAWSSVPQSSIVQNTSINHTAALGDMFLHHHEHTHCGLFWPTCTVLLPQNSLEHQMCINPQMKIVPTNALFQWHTFCFKHNYIFMVLMTSSAGTNELGADGYRQAVREYSEINLHSWFWYFCGICWQSSPISIDGLQKSWILVDFY